MARRDEAPERADATSSLVSDSELVLDTREGDVHAFEELCRRHVSDAWETAYAVTGQERDSAEAVADAFARVLRRGTEVRYSRPEELETALLVATRAAAVDAVRRSDHPAAEETGADAGIGTARTSGQRWRGAGLVFVRAAFRSLPERWRSVLWLTEVRGADPGQAMAVLGVSANGLVQLSLRARAGLRERYLHAHLEGSLGAPCRPVVELLGAYAAATLPASDKATVEAHLDGCGDCRRRLADLDDLGAMLGGIAVPAPPTLLAMATGKWKLAGDAAAVVPRGRLGLVSMPSSTRKSVAGASLAVMGLGIIGLAIVSGPLLNHVAGSGAIAPAAASPTEVNRLSGGTTLDSQNPFLLAGSQVPNPAPVTTASTAPASGSGPVGGGGSGRATTGTAPGGASTAGLLPPPPGGSPAPSPVPVTAPPLPPPISLPPVTLPPPLGPPAPTTTTTLPGITLPTLP